ncbi:MAG: tRNA nucleotidyltransferase/poly(A) polymerase family protein [Acidobacteriaceae bacterium]
MPDYIQLLESKLSPNQRQALNAMTDVARARGITLFLTGGAVRDIISGASVRDLDITVQANPLKFKKDLEKAGFSITGEHGPSQTLYLRYGKQARVEISSARTEIFPKPARPEYRPAGILDDLRRRDFTANAMALSLNEGSWGLLLDPLNGMADVAARQLRLVGNYGFLEDPIRMVRAVRLMARTGWELEERSKTRYDNAKAEGVISAITTAQRGYELEEIAYEEEPLQVMKALEAEGWMQHLSPHWNSHSVDTAGLERLHERLVQLLMAGLHPDPSAAQFRLLTAKLSSANLATLKKLFVRNHLLKEAELLESDAKNLQQQMNSKEAAKASQLWKLLHGTKHESVLWLFFSGKSATVQNRFENFFAKWPEARQKIPNAVLQDMRITPDVDGYAELLDKLTFAFMDGELPNEEAVRKFAEPYSPPAPPPAVIVRRSRAVKRVVDPKGPKKGKKASKKTSAVEAEELTLAASDATGPAAIPLAEQPEQPLNELVAPKTTPPKPAKAKAVPVKVATAVPASIPAAGKRDGKATPGKASSEAVSTSAKPAPPAATQKASSTASLAQARPPAAKVASPRSGKAAAPPSSTAAKKAAVPQKAAPAKPVGSPSSKGKSGGKTAHPAKPEAKAVTAKSVPPANKRAGKSAASSASRKSKATAGTGTGKSSGGSASGMEKTAQPAAKSAKKQAKKPPVKPAKHAAKAAAKAKPGTKPAAKKKSTG